MRILHVFEIGLVGGAFRVVESLATAQRRAGLAPAVLAVAEGEAAADHPILAALRHEGVDVIPMVLDRSRAYLEERRRTVEAARRLESDVVHTHDYRTDVVDGTAARSAGFATVSTLHGFTYGDWRNRSYQRVQRWAVRRGDAVVVVSEPMRQRLLALDFSRDQVHVVPNALLMHTPILSREDAREALDVEPEGFRAGWVGRLSREKGPDVFMDAIRRLDPVPEVSVLGEGPMRKELEAVAPPQVRWHGAIHGADTLFRAFDVLVMSSRTEGTPMVLLEAMRAGTPAVATAVGGVPDVVAPDEAVLVPGESPASLARAIDAVRGDPAAAAHRAEAAQRRLARDFAPEAWVNAYQDVYRRAISRSKGPKE